MISEDFALSSEYEAMTMCQIDFACKCSGRRKEALKSGASAQNEIRLPSRDI